MALNRDLIGKEYGEVEFTVERDRIVQFADAIGDGDPRYRSEDPIAPPTFPTVMQIATGGQVVLDPELGLDYSRVVHGEQEYVIERPLRAGDRLTATPRIADIYAKGPNEFLVTETIVRDEGGEVVVTGISTLISRGTAT
jgi:hypothetical protein